MAEDEPEDEESDAPRRDDSPAPDDARSRSGDPLKSSTTAPDTTEVDARSGVKVGVLMLVLLVLGATVAGATAIGVDIGHPLGFQRSGNQIIQVLPVPVIGPTTTTVNPSPSFSVAGYLGAYVPGAAHDAAPHGVPSSYDWSSRAVSHGVNPPSTDSRFVNLWGQVYVDQTNVRPANTRVNVAGCELWRLPATGSTWTRIQGDATTLVEGGAWSEDFTRSGGPFSLRTESDGTQSTVTSDGYNSHFWSRGSLADSGSGNRGFLVACSTRLILANPTGIDDRAASTYLLGVGADWRRSDYACPTVNGVTVCNSIGLGRFVRVTNQWQRVVFTTLTTQQLQSLPLPPTDAFRNPDGSLGRA